MPRAVALLLGLTLCGCGAGQDALSSDSPRAGHSSLRTVLFNVSYVGVDVERENARDGLKRCLEQPGTAVTISDEGSPPIRQVSVTGGRDDIRRFEQCLLLALNTTIERVPQQVDDSHSEEPSRSLADRYGKPPTWPGDPWTKNGMEVSRDELVLAAGPEHCNWQASAFLAGDALSAPRDDRGPLWVRDPQGVLDHEPRAQAEFQAQAQLPADATWTGYGQDGVELWVAPSDHAEYVYLVNTTDRNDVERWVRGGGGCA